MSLSFFLTNLLASFLLPPLNGLILITLGWVIRRRRPGFARVLVVSGIALLLFLSLPAVGNLLARGLETVRPPELKGTRAGAIVVLGGGRYREAPEYGGDTVSDGGLVRVRYAATLQRVTGLPVMVTGGKPDGGELSEAETMRRVLVHEFRVPVRWVEGEAENTRESALRAVKLLRKAGIRRVLLVTHAWHMRRAAGVFTAAGLEVVPAPTMYSGGPITPLDFVPQVGGMAATAGALHEWLGMAWYKVRHVNAMAQ